jgi:hypothetical protein
MLLAELYASFQPELRRAGLRIIDNPEAWADDCLILESLLQLADQEPFEGRVVIISVAEASVLLEWGGKSVELLRSFMSRLDELRSAEFVGLVFNNRRQGQHESTGYHYFPGLID